MQLPKHRRTLYVVKRADAIDAKHAQASVQVASSPEEVSNTFRAGPSGQSILVRLAGLLDGRANYPSHAARNQSAKRRPCGNTSHFPTGLREGGHPRRHERTGDWSWGLSSGQSHGGPV